MRFTEHESTVAVAAVARHGFESVPKLLRRRSGAATWEDLSKMARYRLLAASGEFVLPALTALPERPTVGAVPTFTPEEYADAAEAALRSRADTWDAMADKKRRKAVEQGAAVVQVAIEAMPPRQDPDALIVPDHL